ncbi:MAG: hypothetical protein SFZ03_09535 [Candidatus Melainabacteria bacterium]|nr:hypothetical protein [Candidatus Melainabacteria bacterium]
MVLSMAAPTAAHTNSRFGGVVFTHHIGTPEYSPPCIWISPDTRGFGMIDQGRVSVMNNPWHDVRETGVFLSLSKPSEVTPQVTEMEQAVITGRQPTPAEMLQRAKTLMEALPVGGSFTQAIKDQWLQLLRQSDRWQKTKAESADTFELTYQHPNPPVSRRQSIPIED